jgi:hypothetical protein
MIVWSLIAAVAIVLLWPKPRPKHVSLARLEQDVVEREVRHLPTYLDSVAALQVVQHRLKITELLDEEQSEAINVLTLALAQGSVEE